MSAPDVGHKPEGNQASDVPPRAVLWAALGLLAFVIVSLASVYGVFALMDRSDERRVPTALERQTIVPPAPRLQTHAGLDRAQIEAAAQAKLTGFAWSDRANGRIRIPIEEAMRRVAAEGWPDAEAQP